MWGLRGWELCLLCLPAVIVVTGEVRGKGREACGAQEEGASTSRSSPEKRFKIQLGGERGCRISRGGLACWSTQEEMAGVLRCQGQTMEGGPGGRRGRGDRGATSGETGPHPALPAPQTKGLTPGETRALRDTPTTINKSENRV